MKIKTLIPLSIRRLLQMSRRTWRDTIQKIVFAESVTDFPVLNNKYTFRQNILHADTNLGKVENIRLAGQAISAIYIKPNQVLSFWRAVGNPIAGRGYFKSRNLVGGILKEDYGGGVCQVSGILYWVALSIGLDVIEMHNHSVDIYTESERFTPLGLDATVVYGYKDFRLFNNLNTLLYFKIFIENQQLVCELHSKHPLSIMELDVQRTDYSDKKVVTVRRRASKEEDWSTVRTSCYNNLTG